ncbi:hypothetical protein BDZ89DRAFT_523760 [Hymenopellis radicata]|nr:hypothetical protein BDZ89DRAFT_523760 [Hymenopellis radicata]
MNTLTPRLSWELVDGSLTTLNYHGGLANKTLPALPPEILTEVFLAGQAISASNAEAGAYSELHLSAPLPFELTVSHVSSFWRAVAHSSHSLWRTIQVTTRSNPNRVEAYVERSLGCFLDVTICSLYAFDAIDARSIDAIFSRVRDWRRCIIILEVEREIQPIITRLRGVAAPCLTYLSITLHESQSLLHGQRILEVGCPRLDFIRLRGVAIRSFEPPLTTVTTLHLEQTNFTVLTYPSFRQILINAQQLENLSVHGNIIGQRTWPNIVDDIPLLSLRSLRICGHMHSTGCVHSGILVNIAAPELQSLVLKGLMAKDLDPFFDNCISKFEKVQSLTLCDVDYSIDDPFAHFSRAFPLLRDFICFNSAFQVPQILRFLADPYRTPVPWPDLENLTVILNFERESLLRDAVRCRINVGRPLRKLRLMAGDDGIEFLPGYSWLVQNITLESVDTFPDCWPRGRDFEDEDDFMLR